MAIKIYFTKVVFNKEAALDFDVSYWNIYIERRNCLWVTIGDP